MSMEGMPTGDKMNVQERINLIDKLNAVSDEEVGGLMADNNLSMSERYAIKHMRATHNLLEKLGKRVEVESLYAQAKYPTAAKVLNFLNLSLGSENPYHKEFDELDELEKNFTLHDFESALKKLSTSEKE